MTQPTYVDIEVPPANNVIMTVPGPQGPKGVNNLIASSKEPPLAERFVGLVWIEIQP